MAAAGKEWEPSFLSWKGLQLWSVGYRAPAICEIFVSLKGKKLSNFVSLNLAGQKKKKKKKGKGQMQRSEGKYGTSLQQEEGKTPANVSAHLLPSRRCCSSLELPGHLGCRASLDADVPRRHSTSFEEHKRSCGRTTCEWSRTSDASAGILKPNFGGDTLRRHSDASVNNLQRLPALSSVYNCGGYERVWVLERGDDDPMNFMLPKVVKLGAARRSDAAPSVHSSGRQDSGMLGQGRSSCSSFSSSSSSMASAAVAKLAGRRSSADSEQQQRHLSQLLTGNPFLPHVTAAAGGTTAMEHLRPSDGLLLLDAASLRRREAELKERIVFFL